jgi:1A family penicillin-binding protein
MRSGYDYSRIRRKRRKSLRFGGLKKIGKLKFLSYLAIFSLFVAIFLFLTIIGLLAWYSKDLPRPDKIREFDKLSTIIYSRNGEPLYDIYADQNLVPVKLEQVPQYVKDATIAVEDKDFYKHSGFSIRGMLRGMIKTIFFGKLQGGSTLTQQLVKNALLTRERTLPRKFKELILSLQIERKYSKDEILEMYLNNVPYGGTAWGIKTAAQTYFNKDVSELNLVEAAMLAGLPQAPTTYSPFGPNPTAYVNRTKHVLKRMREDKYITKAQEKTAVEKIGKLVFSDSGGSISAAHFVMYVRQLLIDEFDFEESIIERGGLRVTTTLDLDLQKAAEETVSEEIEKVAGLQVSNGAVVVADPKTGEILALVGSADYSESKFNVAVQGLRQPGSSIKPITYATAFQKGFTPATLLVDAPTEYPGKTESEPYKPVNYDGKYRGPVQLRYALANSINVVAVKTLALVGVEDMLKNAYKMGLTTLAPTKENVRRFGLSITLGGGEVRLIDLTSAFGVFATGGVLHNPVSILKIEDVNGKKLYEYKSSKGEKVLDEGVAFLISDILSDNAARSEVFGTNSYLNIAGKKVAAKTGTTNDLRDNWTIGYTKAVVVGVWVGNNDNSPMNSKLASGVTGAAPIWHRIMRTALQNKSDGFLEKPDSIVSAQIDKFGGGLPVEGQPTRVEYFIKGTEPQDKSPVYQRLKISKADPSKLANDVEIAKGEYEEKDFIVLREEDPFAGEGEENRWQKGIDEWLAGIEDPKYHPPTEVYTGSLDEVVLNVSQPEDKKQYGENIIKIKAKAVSGNSIKKIEVFINGEKRKEVEADEVSFEVELEKGVYTIKFRAEDSSGKSAEREIKIGVQVPWDFTEESPTETPSPTPSGSLIPTD